MIKKLREATGAGILDCKKALEQSDGDYEKAVDFLREKGLAQAAKRSDRSASEGMIEVYSHGNGRVAVIVEVNCESDFVAREASFRAFAHELALQVAASAPQYVKEEDIPESVLKREADIAAAKAREDGKPETIIPKIVEGSLNKFKDEAVLMRQKYVRDEEQTIQDLYNGLVVALKENIVVRRFTRWELGEASD
jgi:elongation factor Ts